MKHILFLQHNDTKLYYTKGWNLSPIYEDAYKFEDRTEALLVQDRFIEKGLELKIDNVVESKNGKPDGRM